MTLLEISQLLGNFGEFVGGPLRWWSPWSI